MTDTKAIAISHVKNSLREKLGSNVRMDKIFTPERIQACQQVIDTKQADMLMGVMGTLGSMEAAYHQLVTRPENAKKQLNTLAELAHSIRGKLDALGYSCGAHIAQSLVTYGKEGRVHEKSSIICRQHMDVLNHVIKFKLSGNGGEYGEVVTQEIERLVKKYSA